MYVGALCATRTCDHSRWSACACSQYLGMVKFYERMIVETELKFNRKLQEANVDRSKGDANFKLVDQDGWSVQSSRK